VARPGRRHTSAWPWLPVLVLLCAAAFRAGGAEPSALADTNASVRFVVETVTIELVGESQRVDIYRPAPLAAAAERVAVVAHGFGRTRVRHRDLGQALAAAGITAVIPDLPNTVNLWGNGEAVVELVHRLEAGAAGLPPVDRAHLVLIGTSAGGLATVIAASQLPGLAGWIGLDPVDGSGMGTDAAARLTVPAVVLLGPSSTCNLFGTGRNVARAVPDLRRAPVMHGASHCDFEGPTNRFCEVLCGRASGERQARIRAETVAAALELLPPAPASGWPTGDEPARERPDAAGESKRQPAGS
jgi:hypothetical protein